MSFRDILQKLIESEIDTTLGHEKTHKEMYKSATKETDIALSKRVTLINSEFVK